MTEKLALSFPAGIALQTFLMLIMDQAGIALTAGHNLIGGIVLLAALAALLWRKRASFMEASKQAFTRRSPEGYNLLWLFFVAAICYFEYMNLSKCLYFPAFDRDSLSAFDTIGYVISQECTLKGLSLYDAGYMLNAHSAGSTITYAPMVQLSYAYVYSLGAETSKLIPGLLFLSFLPAFYGATRRITGRTGAAIATFFMLLTPEMLAFSSLSITNVIHAVFASLAIIYMALWLRTRERKDLVLCGILLGINMWCRMEGVVFIGAALGTLLVDAVCRRRFKALLLCALLAAVMPLCWVLFMKINGFYTDTMGITHPFLDMEKAKTILVYMFALYGNTLYYGLSFIAFLVALATNAWFLIRKRDNLYLLLSILFASLLYMLVLYQIEYSWDTIENVLSFSAKRFMFCFIPLVWFFAFTNRATVWAVDKLDDYLIKR
jgi:4-amino-4-deoxy-L-arabinose transferase-like glycosyltransferase